MTNVKNENLGKIIDVSRFTYEQKLFLLRTLYAKLIRILETFFSGCFGFRNETLSETEKEAALIPLRTSWRDIVDRVRTKIIEYKEYLHIPELACAA